MAVASSTTVIVKEIESDSHTLPLLTTLQNDYCWTTMAYYSFVVLAKILCLLYDLRDCFCSFHSFHHIKCQKLLLSEPLLFFQVHISDIKTFQAIRLHMPSLSTLIPHYHSGVLWTKGN